MPSNTVTCHTEPAGETKTEFDNKHTPLPVQDLCKNMMRKQTSVTPSEELDSKRELVDVTTERVHTETELHVVPWHVTFAVNGENDISSSSANPQRYAKRWRRLALLRSGDVEPNPSPPRTRSRGGELSTADITAGTAPSLLSEIVVCVVLSLHMDSSSLLTLLQDLWNGVSGSGELSFDAAGTLPYVDLLYLQFHLARPFLTTLHFCALWRLHKSWLQAVPPEFRTPVDFKLPLAAVVLATVSGEIELGLSFVGMFHFLLRRRMARSHLEGYSHLPKFADYQVPNVFGILGVPKSSTCSSSVRGQSNCSKLSNSVLKSPAPSLFTLARARNLPQNFKLSFVVLAS